MAGDNLREIRYCKVCNEHVNNISTIAEAWLIEEIIKEHPEWVSEDGVCIKCIEYYYNLLDDFQVVS